MIDDTSYTFSALINKSAVVYYYVVMVFTVTVNPLFCSRITNQMFYNFMK